MPRAKRDAVGVTYDELCEFAFTLPGVEEGSSYGTPGLKVRGKFMTRLREDGVLVVKVGSIMERDFLLKSDTKAFFITDHYREYPAVLVKLTEVRAPVLHELLTDAWRRVASKKLIAIFDGVSR